MRKAWFDENSRGENGALRELALDDALWDQFNRDYDAWYAERPEDVAADDPARSTYIQCAGSTGVMTVEIRVTGQDGSYKHYVVAREPVADPESWMGIEWDPGEGGPAAVRVHPEEVFTGEQAAPVFRAYVVDGRLPAPELLRPLDI